MTDPPSTGLAEVGKLKVGRHDKIMELAPFAQYLYLLQSPCPYKQWQVPHYDFPGRISSLASSMQMEILLQQVQYSYLHFYLVPWLYLFDLN